MTQRRLSSSAPSDRRRILSMRASRGFVDGMMSVLLAAHLGLLGFSAPQIGLVATATMLGSAALTLAVGLLAGRWRRRTLLLGASGLMIATGLGFALASGLVALLIIAMIGTLNPSSGDVSVFLPTEQALLPQITSAEDRTRLFARYALAGSLAAAFGALAARLPEPIADRYAVTLEDVTRSAFIVYASVGVIGFLVYRTLSPAVEPDPTPRGTSPIGSSRPIALKLAALFSLDSFGSGFSTQAMVALWLFLRFDLSIATAGAIFFWTGLFTAGSVLLAPRLAARIGLVPTMVFTHIPANIFLITAGLMPNVELAVLFLLLRALLSNMDVPARTSYTMSVVPAEHRAATSAITNVPRSLAAVPGPVLAGFMLDASSTGWPLVVAGVIKIVYDLLLLGMFGRSKESL